MSIVRCEIFSYCLPLKRPLPLRKKEINSREGCLIRLTDSDGTQAWGEAAPLPGFSAEDPVDVRSQLCSLLPELLRRKTPPNPERLDGCFEEWFGGHGLSASVRCGIEMAVLNLTAATQQLSLARLLSNKPQEAVFVNGLLTIRSDNPVETARQLRQNGYRAVKLKVGMRPLADDITITREIFGELRGEATLRLDANQVWSFEQAVTFAEGITGCGIEYIEEPLFDSNRLMEFAASTGLPVALDETLVGLKPHEISAFGEIKAVILKPTMLGGLEHAAAMAREAKKLGLKVIISSSFESSLGLTALAHLAAAGCEPNIPAGLATANIFENDLLYRPLVATNGSLRIEHLATAAADINEALLTPVADFQIPV
jgi:O-succinylbenzoate synthase